MEVRFKNESLLQNRDAADQVNRCAVINASEPDNIVASVKNHAGNANSISHLAF